jgi:hypothetical protein
METREDDYRFLATYRFLQLLVSTPVSLENNGYSTRKRQDARMNMTLKLLYEIDKGPLAPPIL